jgi:hypothetical protein
VAQVTKTESILKFLHITQKRYCLTCATDYKIWGAKPWITYLCNECYDELVRL